MSITSLLRRDGVPLKSKLERLHRNWLRKRKWPAAEHVKGDFYRSIAKSVEFHPFLVEHEYLPDPSEEVTATMHGQCYICGHGVDFLVDVDLVLASNNWRETLKCPECKLINRWRSSVHLFEILVQPNEYDCIYITEAITPLFKTLSDRYPTIVGSEFQSDRPPGSFMDLPNGPTRNEDVTRLTFADESFEAVLSFDVLEHVPDYKSALREFSRVLVPGGQALISVPFNYSDDTTIRARIDDNGNIEHLLEPHYHGDPLSDEGVLCYYQFGMELLGEMCRSGFKEAFLVCYTDPNWAYRDGNVMFVGRK